MFTPIKPAGIGVLNDTILNTPQPQATSTVQRKSTLESRYCSGDFSKEKQEKREKQVSNESPTDDTDNSSLGLLDNMSVLTNLSIADEGQKMNSTNTNKELEYARKILQRCSGGKNSSMAIDMNKENNVNVQNITGILPVSSFVLSNKICALDKDQECNVDYLDKENTTNITFEPNEMSARSSIVNNAEREQSLLNILSSGININSFINDFTAQLHKELDTEEFLSDSQVPNQISIDEAHWLQDNIYAMPVTSTDKQELDCSTFSGILEPVDLSIASCAGRKVSVGQYFKRKCDMEILENNARLKPNFDVTSGTPMRRGNLRSVIDSTNVIMPPTIEPKEKKEQTYISTTVDMGENSILSLSTIANTLQDVNSETPRRLVDQLLMAQKKKKYLIEENSRKETYTLPLDRKSMLAATTTNPNKFDDDNSQVNLTKKLSLDSKTINEAEKIVKTLSFTPSRSVKVAESFESAYEVLKENVNDRTATFSGNKDAAQISVTDFKFPLQHLTLSRSSNDKLNVSSCVPSTMDIKNYDESYNDLNIQEIDKKETKVDVDSTMDTLFTEKVKTETQINLNNDVIISKNTEHLCNCIIGMTCKANIELVNRGDRWITCTLKLSEVRGDQQNIALSIPEDRILIGPNNVQSTKIEVKVTKMCKPIIAVLHIIISEVVSVVKPKWLTHMICFKPEELELDIICNSQDKQELDFQYIVENTAKVLPIIFHNKNNINVPIKFSVLQEGPKIFSIDGSFNGPIKLNESRDELTHLVLKPQEKFTANIKCERSQSTLMDCSQKQPQYWKSKLIVYVQCGDGAILSLKEVPLYAQPGTCKIQIIDTDVPVIVSRQHGKLLHIVNSGNVATRVSATVVPMEGYPKTAQEFFIKPGDISLQTGERGSFSITYKSQIPDARNTIEERHAKIKLVAGNNVYYYIVSTEQKPSESENENYLRCDTPCNLVSTSTPTSPQSVTSSRSPGTHQDRNSPNSVVSSVTGSTIPIRATHAALVWNSVKTSKSEIKEFTIRNTSNYKIKIQIDIWDDSKSFKFLGADRQTMNTSMILAMQRTESKTLAVMFNPFRVGPVAGKITIKHHAPTKEGHESQYKRIPLYGYGGCCGKMKISNTFKDASGKIWLALGTLSSGTIVLEKNIRLQNTGDLCAFAKIKVIPKVISSKMDSNWHVNPTELILNSKESCQVSIKFYPKKEDFAILQHCVADVSHIVATLNIVYGDEPTRWRIRRLYNKIKESDELSRNENETFRNVVHPICRTFPGEQLISGLTSIRDPIQSLNDLCMGVQQHEINLTVEGCADDTLPILQDNDDESQLYYSLISDDSHTDEVGGASFFSSQTIGGYEAPYRASQEDNFIVNPSTVTLNPPICNENTVTIFSFFKAAQPFQTNLNSNYLSVVPAEGTFPSKGLFTLKIQCSQRIERNIQDVLEIYTENHKQDVLIKVNVKTR